MATEKPIAFPGLFCFWASWTTGIITQYRIDLYIEPAREDALRQLGLAKAQRSAAFRCGKLYTSYLAFAGNAAVPAATAPAS
jgi:hypothetical protein